MKTLSDIVRVDRRFRKSVRVDADLGDRDALEGFICPPSIAEALLSMGRQFAETGHGAFTWTGPYGSGKSSLAVALASLVGPPGGLRERARSAIGARTAERIETFMGAGEKGWTVVPVVGRRGDPEATIAEALDAALPPRARKRASDHLPTRLMDAAAAVPGAGLLVVIDEMGKFLEQAASGATDVYVFQQLAETANRCGKRLMIVGILHQAFDDYGSRLTREARDEWLKIQGRFIDIPINVAGEEQVALIARAIGSSVTPPRNPAPEGIADAIRKNRPGTSTGLGDELAACWPLHPVVAGLLGPLSRRRFGQNQRSVFGFLNSAEPYGFQEFLKATPSDAGLTYRPPLLWDYLRANLEPSILASPDGHRWSLAVDAIERCEANGGDLDHLELIKTIAVIDLFKERSGLFPTPEVLTFSLPHFSAGQLDRMLDQLRKWSVVIFKRHLGAYAIYAGSDFDIDAAVDQAAARMTGIDFGRLRAMAMLQPILAKRHYHETGALRWFDVDIAPLSEGEEWVRRYRPRNGADGLFLLLIGMEGEAEARAKRLWRSAAEAVGDTPVAVGWARDSFSIREIAAELLALEAVRSDRAELRGDAVARREVDARIARSAADLEERVRQAFLSADWVAKIGGDSELLSVSGRAGLAGLNAAASQIAEARFPNTPRISNELLNRLKPSSNAVAAQKALIKAMVENPGLPRLGIEGFPAEGGLFASLLEATGLHGPIGTGQHGFTEPSASDPAGLDPLWWAAEEMFRAAGKTGVDLGQLFAAWQAPPFGVKDGLLPVLAVAFLLSKADSLAVYLDGAFQPKLTALLVDRLAQEPSAVRLRWSSISDFHRKVLSGVADAVSEQRGEVAAAQGFFEPLEVARGLVGLVTGLRPWVLKTTSLSPTAFKVRNLAKLAHDPNKFLLDDLPEVFGLDGVGEPDAGEVVRAVSGGLAELVGAYPAMLRELEAVMLRELRVRDAPEELAELHRRAETVRGLTGNYRLDAFATRLIDYSGAEEEIEGIGSLAANRPPRDWVDRDVAQARVEVASLAQDFLKAEGLAHVSGRTDRRTAMAIYISDPDRPTPLMPDFTVGANQRREVDLLAAKLFSVIAKGRVERDVALAAVAELGARLLEASGDEDATPAAAGGGKR
ncbi:MAG: ATP-binding protein [Alphaproteobacteria bacterium]|nr:ATP-binding protein [Alphaproteobacteria bacterium]